MASVAEGSKATGEGTVREFTMAMIQVNSRKEEYHHTLGVKTGMLY